MDERDDRLIDENTRQQILAAAELSGIIESQIAAVIGDDPTMAGKVAIFGDQAAPLI